MATLFGGGVPVGVGAAKGGGATGTSAPPVDLSSPDVDQVQDQNRRESEKSRREQGPEGQKDRSKAADDKNARDSDAAQRKAKHDHDQPQKKASGGQVDGYDQLLLAKLAGRNKEHYTDAAYVEQGPAPFVCGNCRFYGAGTHLCEIVHGPYPMGEVDGEDTCKHFCPSPVGARAPIGHEYTDVGDGQGNTNSMSRTDVSAGGRLGGYGGGDTVPVAAEPGEHVINKEAAAGNHETLDAINQAGLEGQMFSIDDLLRALSSQQMASGGKVKKKKGGLLEGFKHFGESWMRSGEQVGGSIYDTLHPHAGDARPRPRKQTPILPYSRPAASWGQAPIGEGTPITSATRPEDAGGRQPPRQRRDIIQGIEADDPYR